MIELLIAAFLTGLLGSMHCFGMCGGVIAALQLAQPKDNPKPLQYIFFYNLGRLSAYTTLGILAALVGSATIKMIGMKTGINILRLITALVLIMMAGYIGKWWMILTHLESVGKKLFNPLQQHSRKWLPLSRPIQALPLGILWGFLPCGLVYSSIAYAMSSASIFEGALKMFFFGLGTLPAVIFMGTSTTRLRKIIQNHQVRILASLLMIVIALWTAWPAVKMMFFNMSMHH